MLFWLADLHPFDIINPERPEAHGRSSVGFQLLSRGLPMTVADLLTALTELRGGRVTVEQLITACSDWSNQPTRPLSEFLKPAPKVPLAEATDDDPYPTVDRLPDEERQATTDYIPDDPTADHLPPTPAAGGPFVPLRLHARGGMGRVWAARDALGREVAFKDLPPNRAADAHAVSRFVREAGVTGRLEHPGVVPVYAAGAKPDGAPFYVMRLIRGRTLTDAIRDAHSRLADFSALRLRDLLGSFVSVCNAVAFAHSRGVIHRDLKPANVMVGDFGEVQVMDWGLARETQNAERGTRNDHPSSVPHSEFRVPSFPEETQAGSVMGTPAYMAPEQASGATDEQDERTDVYGLGAILYECLTGKVPFAGRSRAELLDPARGLPVLPRRVNPRVPAALEAICLKAMQLRPGARYQSAQALAADVRHWLADEPVSARRDPFVDRARRWARRNRTLVTTGTAVGLVAIVGLAIGLGAVSHVNGKLDTANTNLTTSNANLETAKAGLEKSNAELGKKNGELIAARKTADKRREEAEGSREQSETLSRFMFVILHRPDSSSDGRMLTVAQLLERAEKELDEGRRVAPSQRVQFLNAVGQLYDGLGLLIEARRVFERIRDLQGPGATDSDIRDPATANNVATALHRTGETDRAVRMLEGLLAKLRQSVGPDDSQTLIVAANLANILVEAGRAKEAVPILEDVQRRRQATDPDGPLALMDPSNLGNALRAAGRAKEAVPMLEEARKKVRDKRGPDHPETLIVINNLAAAYRDAGRVKDAVPLMEDVLARSRKRQGEDHPDVLSQANNLATYLDDAGRVDEAIALYEDTLKRQKAVPGLGPIHPETLNTAHNLAITLAHAGRLADGIAYLEEVERGRVKANGPEHSTARAAAVTLAHALRVAGKLDRAIEMCERVRGELATGDPLIPEARVQSALAYRAAGKWDKARPLFLDHLVFTREMNGKDSPQTSEALAWMGECLLNLLDSAAAEPLIRESYDLRTNNFPDKWSTFVSKSLLGELLLAQKKSDDAEPLLTEGYEGLKTRKSTIPWDRPETLPDAAGRLVKLYEARGDKAKAAEWKLIEERERGKK